MSARSPRIVTEALGGLKTRILGEPGESEGAVIVLLHGFGAPGTDLVPLAGALPVSDGTSFVFPEAPIELPWGFDSRAWWMVDLEALQRALSSGTPRALSAAAPPGLPAAREAMLALLDDLESRHGVTPGRVVLGGFSQGSMLSLDVALHARARVRGLLLWSTTMVGQDDWVPRMPALAGLPAFLSHGTRDPLLPFAVSEALKDLLVGAGWAVTWHPFVGVHEIPDSALDASADFLAPLLD